MNNENNANGVVLGSVNSNPVPPVNNEVNPAPAGVVNPTPDSQVMTGAETPAPTPTPEVAPEVAPQVQPTVAPEVPPVVPEAQAAPQVQVQPQAAPQAYTNPQAITPTQIPGFEDHNQIGQTPPVSLEQDPKPKKKKNKFLFVLLILALLAGVGYGTYWVLNTTGILSGKGKITITTKNIEVNVNTKLPDSISEYATIKGTELSNCFLDTTEVDLTNAGSYKFIVTCGEGNKKSGTVTVVDNLELDLSTKTVYKATGETLNASEFSTNSEYEYAFVDADDAATITSNAAGNYTVKLTVSKGSKSGETEGKVVILDAKVKGYVNCVSSGQLVDDSGSSPKMVLLKKLAILDNSENAFAGFGYDTWTFTFDDESLYNNYLASYNNGEKITINEVSGWTQFTTDSENKPAIIITKELVKDSLVEEYGAENLSNFASIVQYFNNQGLSCSFAKAES